MDPVPYQKQAFRYVEKQSQVATSELVDTQSEQLRLEELLDGNKPRVADDIDGLHWLLRSPFRYPPLEYGSRFGSDSERGVLYLSETREALEAEAAFYAYKFYEDMLSPPPAPLRREYTVLLVKVDAQLMVDVATLPDMESLVAPESWVFSQEFGKRVREAGCELIRYPSARISPPENSEHCNLAVISPAAVLNNAEPLAGGSYTALIDASGVRIQGVFGKTKYMDADCLVHRPFV